MNSSDRSERLKNLSPAKRALLMKTLKDGIRPVERPDAIPRLHDRENAPLSFAQQRLWFIDQMEPGSSLYNQPAAARLSGELDVKALERSLNEIERRHEVLRTSIQTRGGKGVQVIREWEYRSLQQIDLSELDEEAGERESRRIREEEAREGFELSEGRLMRVRLIRRRERQHELIYTMHHIITDDWSMNILIREM
ncbi:MAG TPA: condensation domain-containing protein, partial [Blastocatellia bacterium]|nr:condensation domain-containing protein [Blastocatellia bacterium]